MSLSVPITKLSITLDDIFGKTEDIQENNNLQSQNTKPTKKYKTKNSINATKSESKKTNSTTNSTSNSKNDTLTNNIDNILNNGLVKFENKIQTSMYFVCYKSMNAILTELQNEHNIIIPKEFIDKQSISIIPNIIKEYTGNLKKRCKKVINLDMICIGRKLDNKQCTRKKHNDSDFCKSHFIKLSNGRIDQPTQVNLRNKRGRKRKVEFDPRQYDNEYITLWEDIINGEKVLVDSNNNIYTFDLQTPQYIGKKDIFNKLDITTILNKISKQKEESTILEIPVLEPIILQEPKSEVSVVEIQIENKIESIIPNKIKNNKIKLNNKIKQVK